MEHNLDKKTNLKKIILKTKNKYAYINMSDYSKFNLVDKTGTLIKQGANIINFVIDNNNVRNSIQIGKEIRQLCALYDILFIVVSRIDVSRVLDSDGIALFNDDINIKDAKKILDSELLFCNIVNDINLSDKNIEKDYDYYIEDNINDNKIRQIKIMDKEL